MTLTSETPALPVLFTADSASVALTEQGKRTIDDVIETASLIVAVFDQATNQTATNVAAKLKEVESAIEASHKAVKAPYLKKCQELDELKRKHLAPVTAETTRIKRLISVHLIEEENKRREDERARLAEEARRKKEEDERLQKAEEERRSASAAIAAAANAVEKIAAIQRAAEVIREQSVAPPPPLPSRAPLPPAAPPAKVKGQSSSKVWRFEVTDIWMLARLHPALVTITPNNAQISEVIKCQAEAIPDKTPAIAGLRIFEDMDVRIRPQKPTTITV